LPFPLREVAHGGDDGALAVFGVMQIDIARTARRMFTQADHSCAAAGRSSA